MKKALRYAAKITRLYWFIISLVLPKFYYSSYNLQKHKKMIYENGKRYIVFDENYDMTHPVINLVRKINECHFWLPMTERMFNHIFERKELRLREIDQHERFQRLIFEVNLQ